jgi:hypothetical protein
LNPLEGEKSDWVSYIAAGRPAKVGAISEQVEYRTGKRLGLQWQEPASDGGSSIKQYTLVHVVENQEDEVVYFGPELHTVLDNLDAGRTYTFRVKATNLVGDGPWSDQFSFLMADKPSAPLNLRLLSFDDSYVSIAWEQPLKNGGQAISKFIISRQDCTEAVSQFEILTETAASIFQFTDETITGGRCYNYVI